MAGKKTHRGRRLALALQLGGIALLVAAGAHYVYSRTRTPEPVDPEARYSDEYRALLARARQWPLPRIDLQDAEPQVRELFASLVRPLEEEERASANHWYPLGMACHAHGMLPQAIECYRRVLELNPGTFTVEYLLAFALDSSGEEFADEALARYDSVIAKEPSFPHAYYRKGALLARTGRLPEAIAAYTLATEKGQDFDMAYLALGQARLEHGDLGGALEALRTSAELAPANGVVHAALARAHRLAGDEVAAAVSATRAAELEERYSFPDGVIAGMRSLAASSALARPRSRSLLAGGDFAGALSALELCRRVDPHDPSVLYDLGYCLRVLGRAEEAEAVLEECVALEGAPPRARWQLGLLARDRGDEERARELVTEALASWGEDPDHELDRAAALASADRGEEALEVLTGLPRRSTLRHRLTARTLFALGRETEALAEFERAVDLHPRDNTLRQAYIDLLESHGHPDEAAAQRERLVAPRSSLPE